jgi:rfaE bifunctional protein kinase chain/domain
MEGKLRPAGKMGRAAAAAAGPAAFALDPEAFRRARVLVVGDVMLDRYWFGEVSRISPEAPVPIVKIGRAEERPGGAANVARNAAALGARVALLSVVGNDEPGDRLAAWRPCSAASASRPACTVTLRSTPR